MKIVEALSEGISMNDLTSSLKSVFGRAIEIDSPDERAAYLDRECGANNVLRAEVEGLIQALDRAGEFMQRPADAGAVGTIAQQSVSESPGSVIGLYKLLEQIGEGGFGVVYLAEQEKPVRRRVALKIIKPGMDTRQVIARFEAERQALAMMDNPNIAKVFDAGTTETGRSYFVMELVQGVPTTATSAISQPASGWNCLLRSARQSSTLTKRELFTAISSRRTYSLPFRTAKQRQKLLISGLPRPLTSNSRSAR
jgi:hypothetical protein